MSFFVHEKGLCESKNIGAGTRIWAMTHVLPGAVIGQDCNVCDFVFIENKVRIGDRVTIKSGVQVWDGVSIEDDVFIGPNVTFTNDRFPRSRAYLEKYPEMVIKKGASLGANATILPGITIGQNAMIGAGSVVTKDIPANCLAVGNPAKIVRRLSADELPDPLVTILVPSYNHQNYIAQLIESIFSQTYKKLQVLVIDDGSKDNSVSVLKQLKQKYSFELIEKENQGLCSTLNLGLEKSIGEFIVIIASDDVMPSKRIAEQVAYMKVHPDTDVVSGGVLYIDNSGREISKKIPKSLGELSFEKMLFSNQVFAPSAMIRKSVFEELGNYPTDYQIEDYYLWLKILSNGRKIVNQKSIWAHYRFDAAELKNRINVYYRGGRQVLLDYQQNPAFPKAIQRWEFSYLLKLCLLNEEEYLKQLPEKKKLISVSRRFLLIFLNALPRQFKRNLALKKFFGSS